MLDANIEKEYQVTEKRRRVYETLTKSEISKLRKLTIGHGNMAKCEDATGKHRNQVMRAMAGERLFPETAQIFRNYILNYGVKKQHN